MMWFTHEQNGGYCLISPPWTPSQSFFFGLGIVELELIKPLAPLGIDPERLQFGEGQEAIGLDYTHSGSNQLLFEVTVGFLC